MREVGYMEMISELSMDGNQKILVKGHSGQGKTEFIRKLCNVFEYENKDTKFAIFSNDVSDSVEIAKERLHHSDVVTIESDLKELDFKPFCDNFFVNHKGDNPLVIISDWKLPDDSEISVNLLTALEEYDGYVLISSCHDVLKGEEAYDYIVQYNNDNSFRFKIYAKK